MSACIIAAMSGCGGSDSSTSSRTLASTQTVRPAAAAASAYATVVQQLYVAYFGRPADPGGLAAFEAALSAASAPTDIQGLVNSYNTNATIKSLIDSFGTSAESQRLYSGDTAAFVTAIFNNVLNRPPQTAGRTFWVNAIDSGTLTRGNAALSIMSGALGNTTAQGLIDAALVNKKIAISAQFTASLDTDDEVNVYKGSDAASAVRAMLSTVTSTTDATAFQSTITSTISALPPAVTVISPSDRKFEWNRAQSLQLAFTEANGNTVTGATCSADGTNISVSSDCGSVTGGRLGTQTITAEINGKTRTFTLQVIPQRQVLGTHGSSSSDGGDVNLIVTSQGNVIGWGSNYSCLLAQNKSRSELADSPLPVQALDQAGTASLSGIVAVSNGVYGALAVNESGEVWSWGNNAHYILGNNVSGTTCLPGRVLNPAATGNLGHIVAVSQGDWNSAALADDGTVYAWGWGYTAAQGSDLSVVKYPAQVKDTAGTGVLQNIVAISAGTQFTLALARDGRVYAWGKNGNGQLGNGAASSTYGYLPTIVKKQNGDDLTDIVSISAGYAHSMALAADGTVYVWGENYGGNLGQDVEYGSDKPYAVQPLGVTGTGTLTGMVSVAAGGRASYAVDANGNVYAWGSATNGQIGDGANRPVGNGVYHPYPVVSSAGTGQLSGVIGVVAGYNHAMALMPDGTIQIWGDGFASQLGQGTTSTTDSPVPLVVKGVGGTDDLNLGTLAVTRTTFMRFR